MKDPWLLEAWVHARRSPMTWRAVVEGAEGEAAITRAAAHALALRAAPAEVARLLIAEGRFDAAGMLLVDGAFPGLLDPDEATRLEAENESARQLHLSKLRGRLTALQERARRSGITVEVAPVLTACGASEASDNDRVREIEQRIARSEADRVATLRALLAERTASEAGGPGLDAWRSSIETALSHGAIPAAEAALAAGPDADLAAAVVVPPPPIWPYRKEPLPRILEWFGDEGLIPTGFERYLPDARDAAARGFLDALRTSPPDAGLVLESVAKVLGTTVVRFEPHAAGLVAFFDDLSAPGFHALGKSRWPGGVPVLLTGDEQSADPPVPDSELLIRLARRRGYDRGERVLHLDVDDVLAVLHDRLRRDRLLSQLGRQLPLGVAFDSCCADVSVRWARSDLPELAIAGQATLVIGAPGMGKTTLLDEVSRQQGGQLIDARLDGELPQGPAIFVDGLDRLDEPRLRRLLHRTELALTRVPAPAVILAGRPEARELLERLTGPALREVVLRPRSLGALTEQATTMLAWVGIEALDPGSYYRIALLSGGNPRVLFHLCDALGDVLAQKARGRRFSPEDVERAWQSPALRADVRGLLWEPIASRKGMVTTASAVTEFALADTPTPLEDLLYVADIVGEEPTLLARRCLRLLSDYGLVTLKGNDVSHALGGPAFLLGEWVATTQQI